VIGVRHPALSAQGHAREQQRYTDDGAKSQVPWQADDSGLVNEEPSISMEAAKARACDGRQVNLLANCLAKASAVASAI
jgi:hypothetical protein